MIVRKLFGLPIVAIASIILTLISIQNLFERATVIVQSSSKLCKVDMTSFSWSGQNEGETVLVKSDDFLYIPPFNRFSLTRGIDEAVRRLGGRIPELPTLLPEGIKFADVYVGPDVMISYSYDGAEDFKGDDITIEIALGPSRVPTKEELRLCLDPYQELVEAADKLIVITDRAFGGNKGELIVVASFVHNDLQYMIGAEPPVTKQDVISMIESMRTAG